MGGGGLLNGICLGLERVKWTENTAIIAMETIGCDSFYQSFNKGDYVTLDAITSLANTLGARKVQGNTLEFGTHSSSKQKKSPFFSSLPRTRAENSRKGPLFFPLLVRMCELANG